MSNEVEDVAPAIAFMCGVIEGFYGKPWTIGQRQELFGRMNRFGMNTYMYAPKDDFKHRRYWRELYTPEESDELRELIGSAEAQNVRFVYALSPGLDIVYSSVSDIAILRKKLDQVKSLGCRFFALLFDDIDDELSPEDLLVFTSFSHAQCTVTNDIYDYLGKPELFLFCPTEYCKSRAVPDLASSEYLRTCGEKLNKNIDILWTGPKVVSRLITVEGIEEVNKVVNRRVTIWDNLHANDYDQTRLFLGPYDGRSTELITRLRGVLTNPNCEFEANFIAMHTLAQWSKNSCTRFPTPDQSSPDRNTDLFDFSEEDESGRSSDVSKNLSDTTGSENGQSNKAREKKSFGYLPLKALTMAVADWLPELYLVRSCSRQIVVPTTPEKDDNGAMAASENLMNARPRKGCKPGDGLTISDVVYLCNFFYLPHESGPEATALLKCARWLIDNVSMLARAPLGTCPEESREDEWFRSATRFCDGYRDLAMVVDHFTDIPNRRLLYDVYSYINDMRTSLALLNSYMKWHATDSPSKKPFKSGEQEPWVRRGGLLADFRRLLPVDGRCNDDELSRTDKSVGGDCFIIRPYIPADKKDVYAICLKTCDDRMDGSDSLKSHPDVPGDCILGAYLKFFPNLSFVIEDNSGICGYVVAANDVKDYVEKVKADWLPEMRAKYAKSSEAANEKPRLLASALFERLESSLELATDEIIRNYPSIINLATLPSRFSGSHAATVHSKLLRVVSSLLSSSPGLHVDVPLRHYAEHEQFDKLGFTPIFNAEAGLKKFLTLAKSNAAVGNSTSS